MKGVKKKATTVPRFHIIARPWGTVESASGGERVNLLNREKCQIVQSICSAFFFQCLGIVISRMKTVTFLLVLRTELEVYSFPASQVAR